MRVLVRDVADDALFGLGLGHVVLLRDAFHRPQTGSRSVRLGVALGCRPVTAALRLAQPPRLTSHADSATI
jgi:hypothetical protein